MVSATGSNGLLGCVAAMVSMESHLEGALLQLSLEARGYLEAPVLIERLRSRVTQQREALQAHLGALHSDEHHTVPAALSIAFELPAAGPEHDDVVAGLRTVAGLCSEIAFGYLVLHNLAHRLYEIATANLAEEHRQHHLDAVQVIHQVLGDVVAHELLAAGLECRCQCPSCAPGICLCWHVHSGPGGEDETSAARGIVVRKPRAGSNAERVGLHERDVILAVDGHPVEWYEEMLARMKVHAPGEGAQLSVRRATGVIEELLLTR